MTDIRYSRTVKMIGSTGLKRLQQARVVVIGLGAVGSYAVEGLARAGVGHLRLVDFDVVQPSNLNRQLYALESTLGKPKVEVACQRVHDINPGCQVETISCFVHKETLMDVLSGELDVVIDAIDALTPKVELLAAVQERGLRVVSSMGAARRWDPSKITVGLLGEVSGCPLARWVKRRLRARKLSLAIPCVYSTEPAQRESGHPEVAAPAEEDLHPRGRQRKILGSLPTITGIFGLTVAHTAIRNILGNLE